MAPPTGKILWAASLAYTWLFPGPVTNPDPYYSFVGTVRSVESGEIDAWVTRQDAEAAFTVGQIPRVARGSVTGYLDATTGVAEALRWMNEGNVFRYYPDATGGVYHDCRLVQPARAKLDTGGMYRSVDLVVRDTSGIFFREL